MIATLLEVHASKISSVCLSAEAGSLYFVVQHMAVLCAQTSLTAGFGEVLRSRHFSY